jgi:hypothetical protein
MKTASIFCVLLLTVLAVDAISRRTDNLPFTFVTPSTLCNRNFNSASIGNHSYTFNSDATCSGGATTSVNRAIFSVSSFYGPAFTVQAYKNIGDANPQFSATLIFYNAFQYQSGPSHTTPEYNPNLGDTIYPTTYTTFFNPGAQSFGPPVLTSSPITGAPAGFNVNSFNFSSTFPVINNISITFYADIVSTPAQYGTTPVNPNSLKISVFVNNYPPSMSYNLALGAYLITESSLSALSTVGAVVSTPLSSGNTGGTFSWDNLAFNSSTISSTATQPLYSCPFTPNSNFSLSGITNQTGTPQQIYFSVSSTVLTFVWDPTIAYTDVGSFAARLQFGMITILFATLMGILL